MGRSAKLLLVLVLLGSIGLAYLALGTFSARLQDAQRIQNLSDKLATAQKNLEELRKTLEQKQADLEAAQMQAATLRASLDASRRELEVLKDELAAKDAELAETKQQYEQFTKAQSGLGDRVRQLESELERIRREKEELEAMLGTTIAPEEGVAGVSGRVELTKEPGLVALRLDNAIPPGAALDFYVHRDGEVVGKVAVRRIYYTNLVGRLADPGRLADLAPGDRVVLAEGQKVPFARSLRGRVSAVYPPTFVTLELGAADLAGFAPAFRLMAESGGSFDVAAALSEASREPFDLAETLFASVVVELESVKDIRDGDLLVAATR